MSATTIPATKNESYGFYGTMRKHADAAWPLAMTTVTKATGENFEAVRAFLDSRHGRHFADEVSGLVFSGESLQDAIAMATEKWMAWRIGWRTGREYDIPTGMPYLTGFVIHCAFESILAA
ncbi:MAG: hypothetical protein LBS70_09930 [Candidatus Accumulibacter sp.]|jgi:hypothetical protein|nr:hypothetical protein [Accumulibacter sp.]